MRACVALEVGIEKMMCCTATQFYLRIKLLMSGGFCLYNAVTVYKSSQHLWCKHLLSALVTFYNDVIDRACESSLHFT